MKLPPASDDAALLARLEHESPFNAERAVAVMERHGLDAFLLGEPANVFHMLGHWPQIARTRIGQPPGTFALIVRTRPDRPGIVTSRFLYYYTWSDGRRRAEIEPWLYAALDDSGVDEVPPYDLCVDRGFEPLSPLEAHRRDSLARVPGDRGWVGDCGAALMRALRDSGLGMGRIGIDHEVTRAVLRRHDFAGEIVWADNPLREIRMVKSPLEISLMARAAEANVDALTAVGRAVREGAPYHELHRVYLAETARRGNRAVFLNVDRASSESCGATIRDGQALFLDGVSHFQGYHGDFARTVFVGDPAPSARKAAEAAAFAWQSVREILRPGLRYSEIVAYGEEAIRKAGFGVQIGFGPHSVGLAHTDEPGEIAGGFYRKPDIALEPGMVLSVDCPVLDTGIGGSAHCEDLVLITSNGCEPIHSLHDPVIVV